jgi:hypothetical protein
MTSAVAASCTAAWNRRSKCPDPAHRASSDGSHDKPGAPPPRGSSAGTGSPCASTIRATARQADFTCRRCDAGGVCAQPSSALAQHARSTRQRCVWLGRNSSGWSRWAPSVSIHSDAGIRHRLCIRHRCTPAASMIVQRSSSPTMMFDALWSRLNTGEGAAIIAPICVPTRSATRAPRAPRSAPAAHARSRSVPGTRGMTSRSSTPPSTARALAIISGSAASMPAPRSIHSPSHSRSARPRLAIRRNRSPSARPPSRSRNAFTITWHGRNWGAAAPAARPGDAPAIPSPARPRARSLGGAPMALHVPSPAAAPTASLGRFSVSANTPRSRLSCTTRAAWSAWPVLVSPPRSASHSDASRSASRTALGLNRW